MLFGLIPAGLGAQPALHLQSGGEQYDLSPYLEYLEDADKRLSISEITGPPYSAQFKPLQSGVPNFGVTESAIWLRFRIQNDDLYKDWLLLLDFLHIDKADLYCVDRSGNWTVTKSGDSVSIPDRAIKDRNIVYKIEGRQQCSVYYMRFEMQGTMSLPLEVISMNSYLKHVAEQNLFLGVYVGILLCLLLYNLFIFFFLKDSSYLLYIIYLFFLILAMTINYGLGLEYLWPRSLEFHEKSLNYTVPWLLIFLIAFTRNVLNLKGDLPLADILLKVIQVIQFLVFLSVFPNSIANGLLLTWFSLIIVFMALYIIALVSFFKGNTLARYYLLAWTLFFIGTIIIILRNFALIPVSFISEYSIAIGSAAEHILLSLVLAKRVQDYKEQSEQYSKELAKSRLSALQNRMSPHFLFNTLNTIYSMLTRDVGRAKSVTMQLAHNYHFLTDLALNPLIAFDEEWTFLENYLAIMKERFHDRVEIITHKEGAFDAVLIPPVTIQPIAENFFKHGMAIKAHPASGKLANEPQQLSIHARAIQDGARITVMDSGHGMPGEVDYSRTLGNIKERLAYNFKTVELSIENNEPTGVKVAVSYYDRKEP
ncbi:MAG: histidine kinase [Leptospiraceae bacterium]|nr:histidine kinase [Leptospiraceae bacterium]